MKIANGKKQRQSSHADSTEGRGRETELSRPRLNGNCLSEIEAYRHCITEGLPMHRLARLATREAGSPTKTSSEDSGDLEANFPTSNLANLTITRTVTQVYTVTPLRVV
uniref:Uncharacterized protein n=1 Tax=Trichogramma kaykai TaxID=54128 RepID=A0ABD2WHJ2_9HYME